MDIRLKVFVEGQNVPIQEDLDGKDAESSRYLLFIDDHPAGVTRKRCMDNYRGNSPGTIILKVGINTRVIHNLGSYLQSKVRVICVD